MATPVVAARHVALYGDEDPILSLEASPLGSAGTCSTPDTELSERDSPLLKQRILNKDRVWAREKLVQLSQEEKVSAPVTFFCCKGL